MHITTPLRIAAAVALSSVTMAAGCVADKCAPTATEINGYCVQNEKKSDAGSDTTKGGVVMPSASDGDAGTSGADASTRQSPPPAAGKSAPAVSTPAAPSDGADDVDASTPAKPAEPAEPKEPTEPACMKNACKGCAVLEHAPGSACSAGRNGCEQRGVYECDGQDAVACSVSGAMAVAETCDGKDNDCDGVVDNGVGDFWFPDCDHDTFAPQGVGKQSCTEPAGVMGCGWTKTRPTRTTEDCDDHSATRHPGADYGLPLTMRGAGLPASRDFAYDLNCDGKQEPQGGDHWSTGELNNEGLLELVHFCTDTSVCDASDPCISQVRVIGEVVCGQPYPYQTLCGTELAVYYLCR